MQEGSYFYGLKRINIKQTKQKAAVGSFQPLGHLSSLPVASGAFAAKRNIQPSFSLYFFTVFFFLNSAAIIFARS